MRGRQLGASRVDCPYKFSIFPQVLEHARVLAAHRAVHNGSTRSHRHGSRCPDRNRAVDNGHSGLETLDVARGFTYEILDLKRITHVQEICLPDWLDRRSKRNVDPNCVVTTGKDLEKRFANLSEPDNNHLLAFTHFSLLVPRPSRCRAGTFCACYTDAAAGRCTL